MTRKIVSLLFAITLCLTFLPQSVYGANNVSDISIDVGIFNDGSAYITQTWNCEFTEGTECYLPIENLGEMSLSDFLVSDENGPYQVVKDWDIDASFQEKSGKCGIVETAEGYELCWGITDYGTRRYAIEYKIDKFVGSYDDVDGFHFQFVNSGMGTLPTDVTVKVTMQDGVPLDEKNCGIWAFGFDGQIQFEEGKVVAYTEQPLTASTDSVIIMLQMDKGIITPERTVNESFETVKEQAFSGSDYEYGDGADETTEESADEELSFMDWLLTLLFSVGPLVIIIYVLQRRGRRKKALRSLQKRADYFREAPVAGNLEATYFLAEQYGQANEDGDLIGAAFLKLINAGCLEPLNEKSVGLFGREKENISLRLVHPPDFSGVAANMLYELLVLASSTDQILQEKELETYCKRRQSGIDEIIEAAKKDGESTLLDIDTFDESKAARPLGLTERGKTLLMNIMGFKKYLLDFSLIGERTIAESIIWQDYLTFATLLGIADRVLEQFEKIYPEATEYSANARYYYLIAHNYTKASYFAAQAARSSGGGGGSSMLGGGGFSGGGGGGGTR